MVVKQKSLHHQVKTFTREDEMCNTKIANKNNNLTFKKVTT